MIRVERWDEYGKDLFNDTTEETVNDHEKNEQELEPNVVRVNWKKQYNT